MSETFDAQTTSAGLVTFTVRVTPRARRDAIEGVVAGALRIRVSAPPVDHRANEAVREVLAAGLNIARSAVRIVGGEHGRLKRVEVRGTDLASVLRLARNSSP